MRSAFNISDESSLVAQFSTRVLAITLAFVLVTPFLPTNNTYGAFVPETSLDVLDVTGQDAESAIDNVMTKDGFLLKPALGFAKSDRSSFTDVFAYSVKPGDNLSSISAQFGIKKKTLMQENNIWNANRLRSGMVLNILPVDGVSHLVKKGDTVAKIAKKYGAKVEDIMAQNQLEEGATLIASTRLIIPGGKKSISGPTPDPISGSAYSYAGAKTGRLLWPTLRSATLTQGFSRVHPALDIANRAKGPIFAAASGRVVKAAYGWNGGYGNYIIIDNGNGMKTLYAHNGKLYVTAGQYVEAGQTISWMGNSGNVRGPTGIHVHFEVRINGVKYDPRKFF